ALDPMAANDLIEINSINIRENHHEQGPHAVRKRPSFFSASWTFLPTPPQRYYFGAESERACGTGASAKACRIAAIGMLSGTLVPAWRPQRCIGCHATGETCVSHAARSPMDGRCPARARRAGDRVARAVAPTHRPRCGGH